MKMHRCLTFASLALALMLSTRCARAQAVRAWEGTIAIPTYKLGPADPNPPFPLISTAPIYPYTMQDNLTSDRVTQTYRAIYLENKYLKITILPELGGHVYSVYDKIDDKEVLYRDHVIKYGLVGPRGAWIAGGMEFSFPFAHTTDTVTPVESVLRKNADGSATAVVGAIDWVSHMYWEIALTLRPNTARLEEGVTLFNATPRNHLYLFWTNAAVRATDDTHYIYPMREIISDDPFATVQSWPVWKGVDQSWYKNDPSALAIFGRDVQRNFFGVYYHQSNYGVVHVSDYRQDPGKKLWTWGTARVGKIWDKILSDDDGSYNEIQSGRFYTQGYREFINPRRVERWTEYWYPVRGLDGGFVEATSQMAINATYTRNGAEIKLTISPVAEVADATLVVKQGPTLLKQFPHLHLTPLQSASYLVPVQSVEKAKEDLHVEIQSAQGKVLLEWSSAAPLDGNPDFVPSAGRPLDTRLAVTAQTPVERLYLQGIFLQKTGDEPGAMKVFDQVLEDDPGYVPALLKEAWYFYGTTDFQKAESLIARAAVRGKEDPSIAYAAGVVYRADGRMSLAKNSFWTSIHYGSALPAGPVLAPSFLELGEIAIQQEEYEKAIELLTRAVGYNPNDAFALADLSVAERLHGEGHDAAQHAAEAVEKMPLLPYALAEDWQNKSDGSDASWTKAIRSDPENYLAIASWYYSLGAWKSSDAVIHAAIAELPAQDLSPLVYYYLAANARRQQNAHQAEQYAQQAASQPGAAAMFPNRITDAAVLSEAIRQNPADAHAKYALGNFLFAHARYDKAAGLWQQALAEGYNDPVLLRNLAIYQLHVKKSLSSAAGYYQRALLLAPDNYRLYTALDEVYEQQGDTAARVKLLQSAPHAVLDQDTVRARRTILLLEQAKPDEALAVLDNHLFKPWEGGAVIHDIFVAANIEKGKEALAAHQPAHAEAAFREAMKYPEDLGTGEPAHPDDAKQLYWLGSALAAEGKTSEATATWKQAASGGTVYSALALKKLGQDEQAHLILTRQIQMATKPDATADSYYAAGLAERFGGNTESARADFQHALALDPLLWKARIALNGLSQAQSQTT